MRWPIWTRLKGAPRRLLFLPRKVDFILGVQIIRVRVLYAKKKIFTEEKVPNRT